MSEKQGPPQSEPTETRVDGLHHISHFVRKLLEGILAIQPRGTQDDGETSINNAGPNPSDLNRNQR